MMWISCISTKALLRHLERGGETSRAICCEGVDDRGCGEIVRILIINMVLDAVEAAKIGDEKVKWG